MSANNAGTVTVARPLCADEVIVDATGVRGRERFVPSFGRPLNAISATREKAMRTSFHLTAACIALIGMYAMAGVHPALGKKKETSQQQANSCEDDAINCHENCKTLYCDKLCNVSLEDCLNSGGIFIDPQRTGANPGKPPRRHRYPVKIGVKPPRHHRHPVKVGGLRPPSAGVKQPGGGNPSGTILRGGGNQHQVHFHHGGGMRR